MATESEGEEEGEHSHKGSQLEQSPKERREVSIATWAPS